MGIFVTVEPGSGLQAETLATGRPVETSRTNGAISVLIGHVVAAKTNDKTATDASMSVPEDWNSPHPKPTELGHQGMFLVFLYLAHSQGSLNEVQY